VDFDQRTGQIQVVLQFNGDGGKLFAEITKRNIGKPVAIFLDGQPISVPTVQGEILGGQAVISGNFNLADAKTLARRLQAGALPVPIKLIAQQTVGPTLGTDSLEQSLKAGLVGFLFVALYMILLYRLPGLVSIVALGLYAALSAATFKLIPVTLTLSGIAGFILSIGIAVDANVLVFERLKEEWMEGKGLSVALSDSFKRAWLSIRDGHMTVLISCAVLYWFSSSLIRGFALTLAIGTIISLFTAVVSTRTLLRLLAGTPIAKFGWLFLKKTPKAPEQT
jgi:preprotein translocase subunit SecD